VKASRTHPVGRVRVRARTPEAVRPGRGRSGTRIVVTIVGLLAVAIPAAAQRSAGWPPPTCPTAGALVAYYVGDGFSFNDDLVLGPGRRAWLCWGSRPNPRPLESGSKRFVVSRGKWSALEAALGGVDFRHLGPPRRQPCCDRSTASLVFRGKTIPYDGYPKSNAGVRALRRAEAILNGIIERNLPDHRSVVVVQPAG
jgi:hypothetical protein